jgi:hypothetical protein
MDEIHEINNSVNYNIDTNDNDQNKQIEDLQEKIIRLEKMNNELKAKNEELTKSNIENDSTMKKMGHVGMRRKFTAHGTLKKVENDSVKIAELIKEKNDLQEINEKMLDLLTEKEMENEDLNQKFEDYKMEVQLENQKNLEKIQSLEDKIEMLENEKGGTMYDIDEVVNEYDKSKERLKQQINDYSKIEEDLKSKLEMKDRNIEKLNEDIQKLEIEKIKLINQNVKNDKIKEKEIIEIEKLKTEIDKLKREITFLEENLKVEKDNSEKLAISHKNEVENFQKKIENEQINAKNIKEEKSKEISKLKSEVLKITKELNIYKRKAEITEKSFDDEKQKNFMIQNKLDKKSKELQELNEYTKKLLTNKDNLIIQYEEKIGEMTKDKNELISQNKQLLENIKLKKEIVNLSEDINLEEKKETENTTLDSKEEDVQHYILENKLLTEEIKGLREQLENQTKDLLDLNSYEKETVRLRAQIESLINDNKAIKAQLEELKNNGDSPFKLDEDVHIQRNRKRGLTFINNPNLSRMPMERKVNEEALLNKLNYEKQLNALKKIKEEEKKDFEEQLNKILLEVATLKVKNLNLEYKNDELIIRYKNLIKSLTNQCNKKGIKLNICTDF